MKRWMRCVRAASAIAASREHLVGTGRLRIASLVEGHDILVSTALERLASPRGLHQNLAHRPRGDAFEMQQRLGLQPQRARELDVGLVHQSRGVER